MFPYTVFTRYPLEICLFVEQRGGEAGGVDASAFIFLAAAEGGFGVGNMQAGAENPSQRWLDKQI